MIFLEKGNPLKANEKQIHFTYKSNPDMGSLCQGDLLRITTALRETLGTVHPYFLSEQYKYFMVLTQSCDLVKRHGKCKTQYITLAAVRDFDSFFENRLISDQYAEKVNGLLLMDVRKKDRAYQFLERLYNNTESDYFFLYKEPELSLPNSMIASLKVSIALKSELHYQECLDAKLLELSDEFKAKLGWLVGNIYSRVGTTDWESIMTSAERSEMLTDELTSHCIIAAKGQINEFKRKLDENDGSIQSIEDAIGFISSIPIETKYDQMIKQIDQIISTIGGEVSPEVKESIKNKIHSSSKLKAIIPN